MIEELGAVLLMLSKIDLMFSSPGFFFDPIKSTLGSNVCPSVILAKSPIVKMINICKIILGIIVGPSVAVAEPWCDLFRLVNFGCRYFVAG